MEFNVGLIGYGMSGSVFHAPIITNTAGLCLKAVVSSDENKVQKDYPGTLVYPDIKDCFADDSIDLIVISTPNTTHYDFAKQALLAGKHVVVEKPFTVNSSEAEELIALAKEKNLLLSVYQNRRWDGDFLTVKVLLESDVLGRISTYESHYDRFRPEVKDRWREKDLPGSGILYDLGAHLIDQALHLFGIPESIYADLRKERPGAKVVDYFHVIFSYADKRVILHSASLTREPGARFILHGEKGSLKKYGIDPQEDQLKLGLRPGNADWGIDSKDRWASLRTVINGLSIESTVETLPGSYPSFYVKMVEAMNGKNPVPVSPENARATIRMIEYAIQSFTEKRTIKIAEEFQMNGI